MNKQEFYNAVVEIYKKTGQGVPGFVRTRLDPSVIDELISEGKLKIVETKYNYLPNDEWICLTNVYCVEEEIKDMRVLSFMRVYLNIDDLGLGLKLNDVLSNENFMKEYNIWLEKNKEQLNKIEEL